MRQSTPHLLKAPSLLAMFCLSYLPLFILLGAKIIFKGQFLKVAFDADHIENNSKTLLLEYGFIVLLLMLSIYGIVGTYFTLRSIRKSSANANPVTVTSIKSKNEEALSYLVTYVLPLMTPTSIGYFEVITFIILFLIYYRLYSTSSLILINPVLNMFYGLFLIEYTTDPEGKKTRSALIISRNQGLNEDDEIDISKVGHRLYYTQ